MTDRVDVVVIGAGVVGCAIAERLSRGPDARSVLVLESGPRIAEGITSRNSGVIHAGIYYQPGSMKAELCIRGNALLYEWASRTGVPHRKIGKLIVARGPGQVSELEKIHANALASGASGLSLIGRQAVSELEPSVDADAAILSSETGIVDPYELSRSLLTAAEERGAMTLVNARVTAIESESGCGYNLMTTRGPIAAACVVNSAGLYADDVAAMAGVASYRLYPCRGDYFSLRSPVRYRHLLYPVKDSASPGLGVHLTIDLAGRYRLGPDATYCESKEDFGDASQKLRAFKVAAERLLGPISEDQLRYDTCGIRPKLRAPHEAVERDFVVRADRPGFVNLVGIESPGLTSSLALAEKVFALL